VVGAAAAWLDDDGGHVGVAVLREARRTGVGSQLLARIEDSVREAGWGCSVLLAAGPAGFYSARSRLSVAERPAGGGR
jgi:GNAT superfamily N-acetyltransferase